VCQVAKWSRAGVGRATDGVPVERRVRGRRLILRRVRFWGLFIYVSGLLGYGLDIQHSELLVLVIVYIIVTFFKSVTKNPSRIKRFLVVTWWCCQIYKRGGVPRVERGCGFLSFEKIKCIFSIAPMGNLEKLRECFSPDALRGGTGRWPLASGVLSGLTRGSRVHRTHQSESDAQRPVCERFATLFAHGSGEHRTLLVLSVR